MSLPAAKPQLVDVDAVDHRKQARRGEGVRSIAKQLGCSRNTARRYLREAGAKCYGPREPRACKLDGYQSYVSERIEQARPRWIPATVLLREIRERGYKGGISQLKAWLAPFKRVEPEPVVRFETEPDVQMQADFTHVRRGRDPLIALVAAMGYSRATFVKFTTDETTTTLCAGLREAFDYFGGVPEHVLFDRLCRVHVALELDRVDGLHRQERQSRPTGRHPQERAARARRRGRHCRGDSFGWPRRTERALGCGACSL